MKQVSRPLDVPSGRIARMTRMGTMAAGVAGNMAVNGLRQWGRGERPAARDLLLTPTNMRRVADELAKMRGAAMKIGQLVSMDTGDVLPPELADLFARLRADADFMPPKQLRNVLNAEWGAGWQSRFATFNVRPIAAASIGQVHKAKLQDGTHLAIKVQYPGIARSIDSDVANVGRLIRMSGLLPKGFELVPYLEEARRQLHDEADYALEAQYLDRFNALLSGDSEFILPAFHASLSTPRILAMSFLEGHAIEDLQREDQDRKDAAIARLFDLMLRELFEFRLMQTDPNFANYRHCSATDRTILLDFGATRELSAEMTDQLRKLFQAGLAGDGERMSQLTHDLGLLPEMIPQHFRVRLLDMITMVFDEIKKAPVLDFGASDLSKRMQVLGEQLAEEGFVPPPVPLDLLYIQRKVAGMFLLATRLKARLRAEELLDKWVSANAG